MPKNVIVVLSLFLLNKTAKRPKTNKINTVLLLEKYSPRKGKPKIIYKICFFITIKN